MTLFTTLLVLIAERLFKLGEHWQLDHRLEVLFRRIKHYSLLTTVLMTVAAAAVVFIIQRLLQGRDYPGDIIPRAFHTGRGDNPAADKPAILRQRHFGGGVADIDPCN